MEKEIDPTTSESSKEVAEATKKSGDKQEVSTVVNNHTTNTTVDNTTEMKAEEAEDPNTTNNATTAVTSTDDSNITEKNEESVPSQSDDNHPSFEENDSAKDSKASLSTLYDDKNGESYTIDSNGLCIDYQTKNKGNNDSIAGILHSLAMLGSELDNGLDQPSSDDTFIHPIIKVDTNESQWVIQQNDNGNDSLTFATRMPKVPWFLAV